MQFHVVIPARYASTRLPGKPLADVAGRPLILRTADRAKTSGALSVVVATDDERIIAVCEQAKVQVVMTCGSHQSGTDRIAEVASTLQWKDDEVVVNVQGDEPFIPAKNITQVATLAANVDNGFATLATPLKSHDELSDPNIVKVVRNKRDLALYFSRAAIPWDRDNSQILECKPLRHLGIYGYKVSSLRRFSAMPVCALERYEQLEQLRALWHGWSIHVGIATSVPGPGVDTPEDLHKAIKYFEQTQAQ